MFSLEFFCCTIAKPTRTVLIECKVRNEQVGRVLAYMFENYLDAEEFGISIARTRNEIITGDYQYEVHARPETIKDLQYPVTIWLKTKCETTTTSDPAAESFTFIPLCTLYPSTKEESDFIKNVVGMNDKYVLDR